MATIKMLINAVEAEEYRIAVIRDGLLDGFYIETTSAELKPYYGATDARQEDYSYAVALLAS